MKRWQVLLVLGFTFFLAATAIRHFSDRNVVTLRIVNDASKGIDVITVINESQVQRVHDVPVGAVRVMTFPAPGETAYSISATFLDGTSVTGGDRYAEPGYHVTERVTQTAIEDETQLY